jgi:serine/threonine-protein kinase HipA
MRKAAVDLHGVFAGVLIEHNQTHYEFVYNEHYSGPSISLTMPLKKRQYQFPSFPSVFEGLLPEGIQLENMLRIQKINRHDFFSQLIACGKDCVGALTIREIK